MNAAIQWPADHVERRSLAELIPYARNARTHTEPQVAQLAASMREWGWTMPVLIDEDGTIIAGHGRVLAAQRLEWTEAPVMVARGWTPAQVRAYRIADNRLAENSGWDFDLLSGELDDLRDLSFPLPLIGFEPGELADLIGSPRSGDGTSGDGMTEEQATATLADRFLIPPFSVLSARDHWWQDRKRAWLALGIRSEVGRGTNLLRFSAQANAFQAGAKPYSKTAVDDGGGDAWAVEGTSVFDPVLTEIAYRWWSPPGGLVLDPFAGGSVRGIVAAKLGRRYVGVELSRQQVEANREQAREILADATELCAASDVLLNDPDAITPIEVRGSFYLKRDDLFDCNGARGGKARATLALLRNAPGAVGAGNRLSPMLSRVARVAEHLGIPCRGHAAGSLKLSLEEQDAEAHGAELVKIKGTNYLSAIKARALRDAQARGWVFVPFGLECDQYFQYTKAQTANIPAEVERIVVTAGSGMTAAAICSGLREQGRRTPILAVRVGLDPEPLIDRWAPPDWREQISIVQSSASFEHAEEQTRWWGVELDPHYEAKAAPFVRAGDLFWLTAIRTPMAERNLSAADMRIVTAPADESAPKWARGLAVDALKEITAIYKAYDKEFVLGAFTAIKDTAVADWIAAGQMRGMYEGDELVAVAAFIRSKGHTSIRDFSGREIGSVNEDDLIIRRLACKPEHEEAICQLITCGASEAPRVWLEIWQESEREREAAQAAGLRWVGSKVRASSEIIGVYTKGGTICGPGTPPEEQETLVRLKIPEFDVEPLAARLRGDALPWVDHYSGYNKRGTWHALALRGFGGETEFIIKPSEMSKKWREENSDKLALELADTPLRAALPEAEALISAIPGEKHRIRLMRLAPGDGELARHADITDPDAGVAPGKTLRIHIPIVTNDSVRFSQWMLDGQRVEQHMPLGSAWYLDTRKPHTAVNGGSNERIHLVMDVESSPALLNLLPCSQQVREEQQSAPNVLAPVWIEGDSRDIPTLCPDTEADFIFSCPPYADLERYSDDARDLSTLDDYSEFYAAYAEIIAKASARLKNDRFACFVVGDVRDRRGRLRDLVGDTVRAFEAAGLDYYNDAILVTALGSLPIRAASIFQKGHRKLGRTHQYVLVFVKGDPRRAAESCGPVEVYIPEGLETEADATDSE
jgi:hypothetical protein